MKSKEILELYCCLRLVNLNLVKMHQNYITFALSTNKCRKQTTVCLHTGENERCEGRAIMHERRVLRAERVSEICMRSLRSPLRLHRERIKLTDCHDDFLCKRTRLNAKDTCNTKYVQIYFKYALVYFHIIISQVFLYLTSKKMYVKYQMFKK